MEAKATCKSSKGSLKKRFEPESKKEIYTIELQTRNKRKGEDWVVFGEDVRVLAEKAYPGLESNVQEILTLNHFLDSPQAVIYGNPLP